jgi:hypothetical protein
MLPVFLFSVLMSVKEIEVQVKVTVSVTRGINVRVLQHCDTLGQIGRFATATLYQEHTETGCGIRFFILLLTRTSQLRVATNS